jgi:hypothetical protein
MKRRSFPFNRASCSWGAFPPIQEDKNPAAYLCLLFVKKGILILSEFCVLIIVAGYAAWEAASPTSAQVAAVAVTPATKPQSAPFERQKRNPHSSSDAAMHTRLQQASVTMGEAGLQSFRRLLADTPSEKLMVLGEAINALHSANLMRDAALQEWMVRFAVESPRAALRWLKRIEDPSTDLNLTTALSAGWASVDPVAASKWLETLPDSPQRVAALVTLVDRWAERDPISTGHFLNRLSHHPGIDPVALRYAQHAEAIDPVGADHWRSIITDPDILSKF